MRCAQADAVDKITEMTIGHFVPALKILCGIRTVDLELGDHLVIEIIELVPVAVEKNGACAAVDGDAAAAAIRLFALAAQTLPGDQFILVFEIGNQGIVELPVILVMIAAAGGRDTFRVPKLEGPAAKIDLMGAVVERFARAPIPEPVPVVGMYVVLVRPPRGRPLFVHV